MRLYGQAFIDDDIPQIITISTNPFESDCFYTDFESGELSLYVEENWKPYNANVYIEDVYYFDSFINNSGLSDTNGALDLTFKEGKLIKSKFYYYNTDKEIEIPCDIITKNLSWILKI